MNRNMDHHGKQRGVSMIEVVIAIGVLAVAIPIIALAMVEAGNLSQASKAETRSNWIIPQCLEEIRASRAGRPQYFTATNRGESFPPVGVVWALAFSPDGKPLGPLTQDHYAKGIRLLDGNACRYIATLSGVNAPMLAGTTPMLEVHVALEYPAGAPSASRRKLEFHTRIP